MYQVHGGGKTTLDLFLPAPSLLQAPFIGRGSAGFAARGHFWCLCHHLIVLDILPEEPSVHLGLLKALRGVNSVMRPSGLREVGPGPG